MGAWGAGSFENDDAMDWVSELAAGAGDAVLREALVPVASSDQRYLEAPDCSVAIAAAEAVAAARGNPSESLPKEIAEWVETRPIVATELTALARTAVERIVEGSELKDLWDESDSAEAWRDAMTDLRKRLE
jgi:hypothetical protein